MRQPVFFPPTALVAAAVLFACSGDPDVTPAPSGSGGAGGGGAATSVGGPGGAGGAGGSGGQAVPCDAVSVDGCAYTPAHELDEGGLETVEVSFDSRIPGRSLNILVRWVPGDIGPRPVVMWSHGGSWNDNGHQTGASWSATFARAGYVVVHTATMPLDPAQLQAVCQQVGVAPAECDDWTLYPSFGLTDVVCNDTATCLDACAWAPSGCACDVDQNRCVPVGDDSPLFAIGAVRPWDVADVYAELGTLAANLETQAGIEVDPTRVLVGGWSGGSQAVLQAAGAKRHLADSVQSHTFEVSGPSAFLAVSPQGPGFSGFYETPDDASWDAIARPTLVLTGDGDEKEANDLTGPIRRRVYERMPPGDKFMFYSTNPDPAVVHGSYNLGGWDPDVPHPLDPLFAGLRSVALAFADRHLRDRDEAAAYLASDAPRRLANGLADWVSK